MSRYGNFKNIRLSVAEKLQRWMCYQLQSSAFLSSKTEIGGRSRQVHVSEEPTDILQHVASLCKDDTICHPGWVKYYNFTFKKFCAVLVSYDEFPVFGKVVDIMVLPDSQVILYLRLYSTLHFDDHYHGYVIEPTPVTQCLPLQSMHYPFVLHQYKNFDRDGNVYIVLKYGIEYSFLLM